MTPAPKRRWLLLLTCASIGFLFGALPVINASPMQMWKNTAEFTLAGFGFGLLVSYLYGQIAHN